MHRALYWSLYVILILIFQECIFRICYPIPELSNFDRINYIKKDSDIKRYNHLRNQNWHWQSSPDTSTQFLHEMNQYGFRDQEWQVDKEPGRTRILFIGDSFVEGVMASQLETIPEGFKKAAGSKQLEIFNLGMMGADLNAYLQLTTDAISTFKPDYLFFCISSNDLTQRTPIIPELYLEPEYFNPYVPRLIQVIRLIRVGNPLKFRWLNNSKSFLPTIDSPTSPWNKNATSLRTHSSPRMAQAMINGTYSPFRTNNLYNEEKNLKLEPALGDAIPFLQYFSNEFDVKTVVVYIPGRNMVTKYYYKNEFEHCTQKCNDGMDLTTREYQIHRTALAKDCQQNKLPLIDLTPVIKKEEKQGNHLYWEYDDHMRGKGYLYMGQTIYDIWKRHLFVN